MVVAMARDIRARHQAGRLAAQHAHPAASRRPVPNGPPGRRRDLLLLAHRLGMNTLKCGSSRTSPSPRCTRRCTTRSSGRWPSERPAATSTVHGRAGVQRPFGSPRSRTVNCPKHYQLPDLPEDDRPGSRDFTDIYMTWLASASWSSWSATATARSGPSTRENPYPGGLATSSRCRSSTCTSCRNTSVIGPRGKPVELQIRTTAMHRRAEYGIAAHWSIRKTRPRRSPPGHHRT